MGLAPYGEPKYADLILDKLLDLKDDGTFRLDMQYFNYCTGPDDDQRPLRRAVRRPAALGGDASDAARDGHRGVDSGRDRGSRAAARADAAREKPARRYLCLAGGVALNCVANGRVLREGPFEDIWIQPAAGDAGGALGAAATVWHRVRRQAAHRERPRPHARRYLGPRFGAAEIRAQLDAFGAQYEELDDASCSSASPSCSSRRTWSAGSRGAWSSGRARSAAARSSAIRAARRCSR